MLSVQLLDPQGCGVDLDIVPGHARGEHRTYAVKPGRNRPPGRVALCPRPGEAEGPRNAGCDGVAPLRVQRDAPSERAPEDRTVRRSRHYEFSRLWQAEFQMNWARAQVPQHEGERDGLPSRYPAGRQHGTDDRLARGSACTP